MNYILCEIRLFFRYFKDFELLIVDVKLFKATAPLYEKDFLPYSFLFGFVNKKMNSACLDP